MVKARREKRNQLEMEHMSRIETEKFPNRSEVIALLEEGLRRNPGPWGDHSRVTAQCAEKIAKASGNLEPEKAYILGLLHDIGRRFGKGQMRHITEGYRFMREKGYLTVARICITHSFPNQDIREYIGQFDISREEVTLLAELLKEYEYHDYDRLIQLCDSIAMPDGPVAADTRMDSVAVRYGYYPPEKRKAVYGLKEYFEDKMGDNLYRVVGAPEALWGR